MKKEKIVNFILADEDTVIELIDFYKNHICIVMTTKQVYTNLVSLPEYLLGEIITGGYDDTDQREQIISEHSRMLINERWPTYGDGVEAAEEFKKKLDAAHIDQGYKQVS